MQRKRKVLDDQSGGEEADDQGPKDSVSVQHDDYSGVSLYRGNT